ncbi:MAG: hypothetical protein IKY18_08470 [Oscillospiraceae bacterium]|nr:hypothetical protein [Oscillospiraceae bacterium]
MSDNNILHYEYTVAVENLQLKLLLEITDNISDPLTKLTPHTHPFAEIFVCHKERILINTPDGVKELAGGDVMIVPPNLPHCCLVEENNAVWQAVFFLFPDILFRGNKFI